MVMRTAAALLVPPWLESLLTTQFFSLCPDHADAARCECNLFCLDCSSSLSSSSAGASFCFYCRSERHSDHRVVQIRRSSYHDVVRVGEVEAALDVSGVQTYVINSARVVFLNERPQPRGGGAAAAGKTAASPHTCEICARSLLDPFRFCSLGCKLVGIKRNGDASFVVGREAGGSGEGKDTGGRGVGEGSRRRKGIPHRAPFAS